MNKNEHLIPVMIIDLINRWKTARDNTNEKSIMESRLIAIRDKIDNELRTKSR